MKRITGHLAERNSKWYAVINLYDAEGNRKEKWKNLDLPVRKGSKSEANHRMSEIIAQYNTGDLYLMDSLSHADKERNRIAGMRVEDYLNEWIEQYKGNISKSTYHNYRQMIDTRMIPFFKPLSITVKEITGDEINDYYASLRNDGLKGTSAQRHHSLLHLAFKQALKRRIIQTNPCDQADRPKAVQFIGNFYNADELKKLIDCLEGDPLRMLIILTAYYGLRRSEVIGLKWSAIDFVGKTVSIRHKVIEEDRPGGAVLTGMDVMKTKSSYRTLPLIPHIEQELIHEKAHQEEMRHVMRSAYNKKYSEYVCVDAIGNLLKPSYVSEHFQVILRQNDMRHIRFHDLRHSCASLMLANGVPMKMIQDWLGHSDMGTTANIYSHIDSASKIASAKVIGDVLSED
ncbi:MAG: tyrosine-type recombinase/integrase [Eubacteriales bacterium]|nr:tyrosine-type recombinase/integrase [Eubacteriales bacterium]